MLAQSATSSDSTISASAKSSAAGGSYSLYVQQVATAGQASYNMLSNTSAPGGSLTVKVGGSQFTVNLADTDNDHYVSVREIAAAINSNAGNTGLVSAGVVSVPYTDGSGNPAVDTRLVLTSKNTGSANTVSLDTTLVGDSNLKSSLTAPTTSTAGQDAIVYLGDVSAANKVTQSSNTFTNIDGVSFTVSGVPAAGKNPVTLTVANDTTGTTANAQAFVDAYNKLKSTIDKMLDPGNPASNQSAGAFAADSGVKALQTRLVDLLRPTVGGLSLASYGITATRDGTLQLDSGRLAKQLAANPDGLDQLMGSASASSPTGVLGGLNKYLNLWSDSATGQIKQRTSANTKLQSDLTKRQTDVNDKYDAAYQRYLKQFTALQTLQATMNSNVSIFDAVFGSDKSS
jgi:flagellar hook-associated protein 2